MGKDIITQQENKLQPNKERSDMTESVLQIYDRLAGNEKKEEKKEETVEDAANKMIDKDAAAKVRKYASTAGTYLLILNKAFEKMDVDHPHRKTVGTVLELAAMTCLSLVEAAKEVQAAARK